MLLARWAGMSIGELRRLPLIDYQALKELRALQGELGGKDG